MLRCPSPSLPSIQAFRRKANRPVLTGTDTLPSSKHACSCFPRHKTKTSRETFFSSSVCVLFTFCCYLRACSNTNVHCTQEAPDFASAASLCKPQRTAVEKLSLCSWQHRGIVQGWGEQAEYNRQEDKQGLPAGTGIGNVVGHTSQLGFIHPVSSRKNNTQAAHWGKQVNKPNCTTNQG